MRRAISTASLSGSLEDKLLVAARAGFDGVELFECDLIGSNASVAELRRYVDRLGLEIMLYVPLRDFEAVDDATFARNLHRAVGKLDVMQRLGADLLLVCSNASEEAIDDDCRAAAQLVELADLAGARGIRIAYDALPWARHVADYEHAWAIVSAARHPALGLCLDSFYILSESSEVRGLRRIPGDKIFFVQLADAPRPGNHVLRWGRHYRCFPGQGCLDIAGFMTETLATGYEGPMSIEVFTDGLGQSDAGRVAVDAMRSLLLLEDDLKAKSRLGHGERWPPVALGGYAFIELTLDFGSLFVLEQLLHLMGFSNVAAHSSRRVDLWQQASIRLLLSRIEDGADEPQLAAIGVESSDPNGSLRRAQELRAAAVALRQGSPNAEISAITAPDGTGIFFCRTSRDDGSSWPSDFRPLPDAGDRASAHLLAIDHVSLPQSLDCFDESILFYRSVLGLAPRASDEQVSPGGLFRSRALADVRAGLRFVLNAVAPGDGRHGAVSTAQHLAFSCQDALRTARSFAELGIPIVPVSHNYYDDLAARFELEPGFLRQLKESSVLYDRADDGEFLHFYIEIQGARLCFEVVERRGRYSGYGATNAPVREAALGTRSVTAARP